MLIKDIEYATINTYLRSGMFFLRGFMSLPDARCSEAEGLDIQLFNPFLAFVSGGVLFLELRAYEKLY